MIKIKSVAIGYPAKEANGIKVRVMPFQTSATSCSTYYELVSVTTTVTTDEEGKETSTESIVVLADGNSPISEEQFTAWGNDNVYIEDVVLSNLSLERE